MALLAAALLPAGARAAWSRPFDLVAPGSLDLLPTQLAVSPSGASAAALSTEDVDTPGSAQAYLVSRSVRGALSPPVAITGAQQILAVAYAGSRLELLTGTSPSGLDCCSSTQAVPVTGATQQPAVPLLGGLTGFTLGRLVPLAHGRMLAAVAAERGVWAAQTRKPGRFATPRRLSRAAAEALSATAMGGQSSLVAWTASSGPAGLADPRSIFYALGSRRGGPHSAHSLLRVPAGHRIDELSVGRSRSGASAMWIEEYYDRRGNYHSVLRSAEFVPHPRPVTVSASGAVVSGLAFAANSAGSQAAAWTTCRGNGSCTVHAASRRGRGRFVPISGLGFIDATQPPTVAVGPRGQVLLGWVRSGRPLATLGSSGRTRHGRPRALSSSPFASDEAVAFGPRGHALAAWTQGTLHPSVVAAAYG